MRNQLSYQDLMNQREHYELRSQMNGEVPVKDHFNT